VLCSLAASKPSPPRRTARVVNESCLDLLVFMNGGGPIARIGPESSDATLPFDYSASLEFYSERTFKLVLSAKMTPPSTLLSETTILISKSDAAIHESAARFAGMIANFRARRSARRARAASVIQARLRPGARRLVGWRHDSARTIQSALGRIARRLIARRARAATLLQARARGMLARLVDTCQICLEDMPRPLFVGPLKKAPQTFGRRATKPRACHKFCQGCLAMHVGTQIDEGRLHIKCPGERCSTLLEKADLQAAVSPQKFESHKKNLEARHGERLADLTSGELDQASSEFLAWCMTNTRVCPTCSVIVYRYAGCNHMSCRCGASFDWNTTLPPLPQEPAKPQSEQNGLPRASKVPVTFRDGRLWSLSRLCAAH